MRSKDVVKNELKEKLDTALASQNAERLTEALADFAMGIQQEVVADFKAFQRTGDQQIMAKRGVRQLTSAEEGFYTAMMQAVRTGDIKQAFTGIENDMPETVIDAVLDDISTAFPLLGAINVQNTAAVTKMLINKKGVQLAMWGALGSKITEELEGAIGKIDITTNKLTAFMPVSKDMLDAGPAWIDAYVRAVLTEALGGALCKAVVAGTGKDQPIGMLKDVSATANVQNGVYPDKEAITLTEITPKTIGGIAKTIATGPNGRTRVVPELLLVVNPVDYFEKIMPATTLLLPDGTYRNNVMPYPTRIEQDINVPTNKVIFGLADRYFMGVGKGGIGGKIEYDDSVRFLDDERVYLTKMYGNGRPLDENAFVVADITNLKEAALPVAVKGTVATSAIVEEVKGVVTTKAAQA